MEWSSLGSFEYVIWSFPKVLGYAAVTRALISLGYTIASGPFFMMLILSTTIEYLHFHIGRGGHTL